MATTLLVRMGAKEASKLINSAVEEYQLLERTIGEEDRSRANESLVQLNSLFAKMKQVNEWLVAIQEN